LPTREHCDVRASLTECSRGCAADTCTGTGDYDHLPGVGHCGSPSLRLVRDCYGWRYSCLYVSSSRRDGRQRNRPPRRFPAIVSSVNPTAKNTTVAIPVPIICHSARCPAAASHQPSPPKPANTRTNPRKTAGKLDSQDLCCSSTTPFAYPQSPMANGPIRVSYPLGTMEA